MKTIRNRALLRALCSPSDQSLEVAIRRLVRFLGIFPQSESDIHLVLEKAESAQKQWAKTTAKERAAILKRWFQAVIQNQDDLARIMTLEQGKPLAEAKGEVVYAASFIEVVAEQGKRTCGQTIPAHTRDRRVMTIKQPIGVAAAITSGTFPLP